MTEIDNDKLLRDFFTENRQEIADRGFSRRVMHHLPDRSHRHAFGPPSSWLWEPYFSSP